MSQKASKADITNYHFDYINNMVKVLGFNNLIDYNKRISNKDLKSRETEICNEFNASLEVFKKLFPQEGFDLRKIDSSFKNINQVLGFVKKILHYLHINWKCERFKGTPTIQLVEHNDLYDKYVSKLSKKLPVADIDSNIKSMKNIVKYLKKPHSVEYIINSTMYLSHISYDFDYFNWIKIRKNDDTKLDIDTKIRLSLGGDKSLVYTINESTMFDENNYYQFNIKFPNNNLFFRYSDMQLHVSKYGKYNILANGSKFKSTLPDYRNYSIIYDHDPLWYQKGTRLYRSCSGMIGNKYPDLDPIPEEICPEMLKSIKKVSYIEIDSATYSILFLDAQDITKEMILLTMLNNKLMRQLGKQYQINNIDFVGTNQSICWYDYCKYKTHKNKDRSIRAYIDIVPYGDICRHIDIKLDSDHHNTNTCNAWIEHNNTKLIDFGKIKFTGNHRFINDKMFLCQVDTCLVIEIPESEFKYWSNMSIFAGYLYMVQGNDRLTLHNKVEKQGSIVQKKEILSSNC